jgi:hypothetical protein
VASPSRAYLRGRLVGRITAFHNSPKGFAFLETGKGQPEYFVARQDVPASAWFEGSLLEFTPAPPKPNTKAMRAEQIIPRNQDVATQDATTHEVASEELAS